MPFTERIFRLLETELNKQLAYSFLISRRMNSKGSPTTVFRVYVRNDSGITLTDVRGSISPGPAANFRLTTFRLPSLAPKQRCEIAQIEARILEPTRNRFAFDRMATVDVTAKADLSNFRFTDTNRPLTYVQTSMGQRSLSGTPGREPIRLALTVPVMRREPA